MTKSLIFILSALLLGGTVFGQDPISKKELKNGLSKRATLKLADRYYAESTFYSSAENYRLYLQKDPGSRYANYWLAMALYQARDYKGSEEAFAKFYSLTPGKKNKPEKWEKQNKEFFKLGHLYYGMALHRNGKYDDAITHLQKFRTEYYSNNKEEENALIKLARLESLGCDSSKVIGKQKVKVKKISEEINNPYTQAAPFLYNDNELYYTSLDQQNLVKYTDQKNKKYTNIYKSTRDGKEWKKGVKLPASVNEAGYFTGNGTFNQDRSRFYFTKCLERDDDRSLCNIFVADVKNGKITGEPTRLPEGINFEDKYTATHPAVRQLDAKREIVYYVTDREGGKGGLDIWYTQRNKDGQYMAPRALSHANTVGDEVTPYFEDSIKALYFSSDGFPGLGGYDVFMTRLNDEGGSSWTEPVNVGRPINSGADELYYSRSKDQSYGYLTSNREGSTPLAGISTASDDIFYWENLHFAVDGELSKKGDPKFDMTGARFNLYVQKPDGTKELIGVDSTSTNGKYFFNLKPDQDYVVEAEKTGFLPQVETLTTKGLDYEDTLNKNMRVAKGTFIVYGKIMEDSVANYPGIMNATIVITERSGGREIDVTHLVARDSFYYVSLATEKEFKILAQKQGFFANSAIASTKNLPQNTDSVRVDIKLRQVHINVEYKLENILYDFDKSTLTANSKLVLDTLFQLLRDNPFFEIELSSHTDGKGKVDYNQRLSQARAQSCVDYLIKKGIAKKRMIARGYGMSKPIAPNTKEDGSDDPDGRALNRRTEFKILKG